MQVIREVTHQKNDRADIPDSSMWQCGLLTSALYKYVTNMSDVESQTAHSENHICAGPWRAGRRRVFQIERVGRTLRQETDSEGPDEWKWRVVWGMMSDCRDWEEIRRKAVRAHPAVGPVCHDEAPKGSCHFLLDLTSWLQHCPICRGNRQTSESYRFIPVITSHDLLWVDGLLSFIPQFPHQNNTST